jgi:hypothetical protein
MAITAKIHKHLPSSLGALLAIAKLKFTREQIEQAIADKSITTFSDASDVKKLARSLGLLLSKQQQKAKIKLKPKRERIAQAFELLARLGVTVDDLIEETRSQK